MKKINYLLPLLVVPFLLGCGGGGGGGDSSTKVTEEEFYKAMRFEGVNYLQTKSFAVDDKTGEIIESLGYYGYDYAPNAYRQYEVNGENPQGEEYDRRIYKKWEQGEERYVDYWRPHLNDTWKKTYTDGSGFQTIAEDVVKECSYIFDLGYTYKDYTYDSEKKAYCITIEQPDPENHSNGSRAASVSCYFENKKLVGIATDIDSEIAGISEKYTYAYDMSEIEEPSVETWTATIDLASRLYGKFTAQHFSAAIKDSIGGDTFTINFKTNDTYRDADFRVSAKDEREGTFNVDYVREGSSGYANITIKRNDGKVFEIGDSITLHFEKILSWTVKLDSSSQQYGTFENGQTYIAFEDHIGGNQVTINFVPKDEYKETDFEINANDTSAGSYYVTYAKGEPATITLEKLNGTFAIDDNITLVFQKNIRISQI